MKLDFLKKGLLLSAIVIATFFTSCSDKEKETETPKLTESEIRNETKEVISSVLSIKDLFVFSSSLKGKSLEKKGGKDSICKFSKVFKIEKGKFRFHFDPACVFFGKTYEGTLEIEYKQKGKVGGSIILTFDNFKNENVVFNGTAIYDIVIKDDNEHLYVSVEFDLVITSKDGKKHVKKGKFKLEKVEGNDTFADPKDDVYEISGNWLLVDLDGVEKSIKITKGVVVKSPSECAYPISGTVEIKKGSESHTIDFGDGICDNKFTFDGIEFTYK